MNHSRLSFIEQHKEVHVPPLDHLSIRRTISKPYTIVTKM